MRHNKKIPRRPLEDALFFVGAAHDILYRQHRNTGYMADDHDFALLQKLAFSCEQLRIFTLHTEINLRQRLRGLPESPLPKGCERPR